MVSFNNIIKVIEEEIEKCKATAQAKNIGGSGKNKDNKSTYKDGTEITTTGGTPDKIKHEETEAEKLERRQTLIQETNKLIEEELMDALDSSMHELGIEGHIYFSDDGLEFDAEIRKPEYDERGEQVDSYALLRSKTLNVGNLTDEDKDYLLEKIIDNFDGSVKINEYVEYEDKNWDWVPSTSKKKYYKVTEEYWRHGDFKNGKNGVAYHLINQTKKKRVRI